MLPLLLALLIGVVAGLRTLTPPAFVSWAAALGWLDLSGSWLAFLGHRWAPWITSTMTVLELFADQHPLMPSRKLPFSFLSRIASGALCGGAIGIDAGMAVGGLVAGAAGAVVGTLGGYEARTRLAVAFGRDLPAALIEDAVALAGALLIVMAAA